MRLLTPLLLLAAAAVLPAVNEALTALGGEKFLAMEESAGPVAGRLGPVEVIKVPFKTVIQQAGQPFGESTISSFTANTGLKADEVGKKL